MTNAEQIEMKRDIERILIVDDEEDICFLLKSILKRHSDAKIDVCNSVFTGKEKLKNNTYDLVFFDMRLNDGTGEELILAANGIKKENRPYIAVISAYSSELDMERLSRLNINEFVPKPLSTSKIVSCYQSASEK